MRVVVGRYGGDTGGTVGGGEVQQRGGWQVATIVRSAVVKPLPSLPSLSGGGQKEGRNKEKGVGGGLENGKRR